MATTKKFSGSYSSSISGTTTLSGDESGSGGFGHSYSKNLNDAPATGEIQAKGGFEGDVSVGTGAGVTLQLAHATDPFQGGGDTPQAMGYLPSGVDRLRILSMLNNGDQNVTASIPAANGLAGLGWAADDVVATLQPGGQFGQAWPNGSSVLTAGTNDGLKLVAASGTQIVSVCAVLG